jgi:CRP-like cAMP-binding protein
MPEFISSRTFTAGEEIFRIGSRGRHAYFIESGSVEVSIPKNGDVVVIAELGVEEIFGEMSMITASSVPLPNWHWRWKWISLPKVSRKNSKWTR